MLTKKLLAALSNTYKQDGGEYATGLIGAACLLFPIIPAAIVGTTAALDALTISGKAIKSTARYGKKKIQDHQLDQRVKRGQIEYAQKKAEEERTKPERLRKAKEERIANKMHELSILRAAANNVNDEVTRDMYHAAIDERERMFFARELGL